MNPDDKEAPVKPFSTLHPFTERRLSDSEWSQLCLLLDCWTQGFSQWSFERSKSSQPTPQAAWAHRQQDKRSNGRQPNSQQGRNQTRNCIITRMVDLQKAYRQNQNAAWQCCEKPTPPVHCTVPIATVVARRHSHRPTRGTHHQPGGTRHDKKNESKLSPGS